MVTFSDIVDEIMEALGLQAADLNARNKIKKFVNQIYIGEVIPFKRWFWLQKSGSVVHKAYYNAGTAKVTPSSTEVILDPAPNVTEGSFRDYKFSVDGSNKIYTISDHTAGDAVLTLSSEYQENLDEDAKFKIWRDSIDLPTDAKEAVEVWHAEHSKPLKAIGLQELRKIEAARPKVEGFPTNFSAVDFYDPSSDDPESESDRYRRLRIYPSITKTPVTINFDYIQEVDKLEEDEDEPILPISDRIVLYYGACALAWQFINRNEEMHDKLWLKFQQKLSRMAGDLDEGQDQPTLAPKSGYLNAIRGGRKSSLHMPVGGQSSVALPSYLKDVRIDGATIVNDIAVDDGITIDGRDISADGDTLDQLGSVTPVTLYDNTSSPTILATWNMLEADVVHMNYSIKRDSQLEAGNLTITASGNTATFAHGGVTYTSDLGVTLSVAAADNSLKLYYVTTSTGHDATFKYQQFKWLG